MSKNNSTVFGFPEAAAEEAVVSVIPLPARRASNHTNALVPCSVAPTADEMVISVGRRVPAGQFDLDVKFLNNLPISVERTSGAFSLEEDGLKINEHVYNKTMKALRKDQIPVLISEEHSTTFGAVEAACKKVPVLSIFHIAPQMNKRQSTENEWASEKVMLNVASRLSNIQHIIHVGVEDIFPEEIQYSRDLNSGKVKNNEMGGILEGIGKISPKVWLNSNHHISENKNNGRTWLRICNGIIAPCREHNWVSIDLNVLQKTNSMSYDELLFLMKRFVKSGHKIVGMDIIQPTGYAGNPTLTAKLLRKLIAFAAVSQKKLEWKEAVKI
jgi:hypothetical protein